MLYSALISEIGIEAHALPETTYIDLIKQKFFDAVVDLIPTASIDYLVELINGVSYTVASNQITLESNFMRFITLEHADNDTSRYRRYVAVDADKWKWLGIDSEQDPPAGVVYYYLNGRVVRFYSGSAVDGNKVQVRYIKYPTAWEDTDEMYDKYHPSFISVARQTTINNLITILRGEQNDVG